MNRDPFPLIIAGISLLLAGCAQDRHQPPPRPMFGPGSDRQPAYPAGTAPAYPQSPATAKPPRAGAAASAKWQTVSPPQSGAATWQPIGALRAQSLGHGATLYQGKARSLAGASEINLVVFDSRQCAMKVIDQPQPNASGGVLTSLMRSHNAIAGVNGGFFHPDFQPLGIFIASGRKTGQFTSNQLLSGSVLVIGREPYLIWNSEFLGEQGVTDLIQCGPRLVDSGRPIEGLKTDRQADRTFVATDGKRTWAIGAVRSTSLAALAALLAESNVIPGLRVQRALNLDGGHSTAFWARTTTGHEISQPGFSTVRNYLAIIPR